MVYDTAKMIVPLVDIVARWSLYSHDIKYDVRTELKFIGLNADELAAVIAFLDALDKVEDI